MPAVSEKQRRAMYAAAEGRSTLGIPSSVGKEYIKKDSDEKVKSAGIVYRTPAGEILLIKRGVEQDHPGEWAFPGGHLKDDESPKDAAIREFNEEVGGDVSDAAYVGKFGKFAAFVRDGESFDVKLSDESQDYGYFAPHALPTPMHPRAIEILESEDLIRAGMHELDIARQMAAGNLSSPQQYANSVLFKIRITGTGLAYRSANEEFTWRSPNDYLTSDFVDRCNGLMVILDHPKKGLLDGDELRKRVIGAVIYPFIDGDDVMGIARIIDLDAAELMASEQLSTSPSVVTARDATLVLSDGSQCNIEGAPVVLDHVAICAVGVWDKGGEPAGVIFNDSEDCIMTDEVKSDTAADPMKALADSVGQIMTRLDSFEKKLDKMKKKADKAKKDSAKKDGEPTEQLDDKKADAQALEKADGQEEEGREKEIEAKADSDLRAEIERMKAALPTALSDADLNDLSAAQAKADSVFTRFGDRAPRYMQGETPSRYRRRIAASLQKHSDKWRSIDINGLDDSAFAIAEGDIYADSAKASAITDAIARDGELRQVTRRSASGHTITEFYGDQYKASGGFMARPQTAIFTQQGK